MAGVKIWLISNLNAKNPISEDPLTPWHYVQVPVGGIIKWDALRARVSAHVIHNNDFGQPWNQLTLTKVLILDIMYKISGVYTSGGVCGYKAK